MLEYLLWAPDRATFLNTLAAKLLPGSGLPLLTIGEDGNPIAGPDVLIDEVGEIIRTPAVLDAQGNVVTPAGIVPGWHINMVATGSLAQLLIAGLPQTGEDGQPLGLFERTRLLEFLGETEFFEKTEEGVPAGYVGKSGIRVYDPAIVNHRARVWQ